MQQRLLHGDVSPRSVPPARPLFPLPLFLPFFPFLLSVFARRSSSAGFQRVHRSTHPLITCPSRARNTRQQAATKWKHGQAKRATRSGWAMGGGSGDGSETGARYTQSVLLDCMAAFSPILRSPTPLLAKASGYGRGTQVDWKQHTHYISKNLRVDQLRSHRR